MEINCNTNDAVNRVTNWLVVIPGRISTMQVQYCEVLWNWDQWLVSAETSVTVEDDIWMTTEKVARGPPKPDLSICFPRVPERDSDRLYLLQRVMERKKKKKGLIYWLYKAVDEKGKRKKSYLRYSNISGIEPIVEGNNIYWWFRELCEREILIKVFFLLKYFFFFFFPSIWFFTISSIF